MITPYDMLNKRLIIGFYAHGVPFDGDTIKESALGGSESAVYFAAKELALKGHIVFVFSQTDKPGVYDDVTYYNITQSWKDVIPVTEFDIFIVARDYTICSQKIRTKMLILWAHDILLPESTIMEHIYNVDIIWCLSEFHKQQFLHVEPLLEPLIKLTRNGVDLEAISTSLVDVEKPANGSIFVYGSRPERGLKILLRDIWPRILEEVDADAVLYIAGYDVSQELLPEHVKREHAECWALVKKYSNSVQFLGHLKKEQWYKVLASATAVLYPTDFPEISCINALEAQACGTPIVTTNRYALSETVAYADQMPTGHPENTHYQDEFISIVKNIVDSKPSLNRPDYAYALITHGLQHAERNYTWSDITDNWLLTWWSDFIYRSSINNGVGVLRQLEYHSDLVALNYAIGNAAMYGFDDEDLSQVFDKTLDMYESHHDDSETYADTEIDFGDIDIPPINRLEAVFNTIDRYLEETGKKEVRILDVGCGQGVFAYFCLQHFKVSSVLLKGYTGIDFSEILIERSMKLASKFRDVSEENKEFFYTSHSEFITGNIYEIDPVETHYDVVFAGEWLEHQKDYKQALRCLENWCKDDGTIILTIPNGPWEALSYRTSPDVRHHVHHFELQDVLSIFSGRDFSVEYIGMGISPKDGSLLGNRVITFSPNRNIPFGAIDYDRKILTQRPYQYISCCMITKDEEDNISRCLKSVVNHVDETIIVDTGSLDKTQEIILGFEQDNVTLFEQQWEEDFSIARNISLSVVDRYADWILWIDADEVLVDGNRLKKYAATQMYPGYIITQNHLVLDLQTSPDIPVRFFNAHKNIQFYGCVHEHPEFKMNSPIYPTLILPDVKIAHYGYITESMRRDKSQNRNFKLLLKDRKQNPDRMLGVVLEMRDYMNLVRWEREVDPSKTLNPRCIQYLKAVVAVFKNANMHESYRTIARTFYQEALELLGRHQIAIDGQVPVEMKVLLGGSVGGYASGMEFQPVTRWVIDQQEIADYMTTNVEKLTEELFDTESLIIPSNHRAEKT